MRAFHRLTRMPLILAASCLLISSRPARADETGRAASADERDTTLPAQPASSVRARQSLKQWLNALALAESGNRAWIVHRDRDGRDYYGCLQFRETTFRYFVDKFELAPDAEDAEVMELIYDCAFQKRLAARMIRENPENWKHWRNTVQRIGLPPGSDHSLEVDNRKPTTNR
jgi:hypothetical protein